MSGIVQGIGGGGGAAPLPANTVTSGKTPNVASTPGVSAEYSRGDHQHGTLDKATTVVGPVAFGAAAIVGVANKFSPEDHSHGLPSLPAGLTEDIVLVCEVTCVGAVLSVKTTTLHFVNGILISRTLCA